MNEQVRAQVEALEAMRLPELQARYAEVVGEPTQSPNRTHLVRRITEVLEAQAVEGAQSEEPIAADVSEDERPLTKLTVEELQARYLEEVGRPTGSSNKGYLVWKIREARRGRVPVGPVGRRAPGEPAVKHKVLPLRLPAETVAALDGVWRRRGLRSRMELFRKALEAYLTGLGEEDAAARVRGA